MKKSLGCKIYVRDEEEQTNSQTKFHLYKSDIGCCRMPDLILWKGFPVSLFKQKCGMCIEKRVSWGGKISTIWEFCQEVKINFYIKQIENVFCSFEVSYFHDIFCLLKGEFHSFKGAYKQDWRKQHQNQKDWVIKKKVEKKYLLISFPWMTSPPFWNLMKLYILLLISRLRMQPTNPQSVSKKWSVLRKCPMPPKTTGCANVIRENRPWNIKADDQWKM